MPGAKRLTTISLFSGCGGLDLGLSKAGFTTRLAVESNPTFAASYVANFPKVPTLITQVEDLTPTALRRFAGLSTHETVDLVAGGPPCPPFSKSRFYRLDKPRALEDPDGESTVRAFLRVVRTLTPRAFLFENVPGFAYKVHNDALRLVERSATELGYSCTWRIINAADYGVPQIRERFFLVGTLSGQPFQFPSPTHARVPDGSRTLPWRTAGDAIGDLDTAGNADDGGHFAGGRYHDLLEQIPPGDNYLFFTAHRGHPAPRFEWRSRYWSFLLKLSPSLPSWTIQARRSNNMGPFHWRNRILRIHEIKRLQTFPDDWHLEGTIEDQWRQIGNAVPPLLSECLGHSLAVHLRTGQRTYRKAETSSA